MLASLLVVYTHSFPMALGAKFHEPLIGLPFSLGIYSFPVGQLLVFPFGISNSWVLFVLSATVAAMLSWLCIEKPVLDRKRKVTALFHRRNMSDAP